MDMSSIKFWASVVVTHVLVFLLIYYMLKSHQDQGKPMATRDLVWSLLASFCIVGSILVVIETWFPGFYR